MLERIEKLENELSNYRQKFELLEKYIESETEKTKSLILLSKTINEFMNETNRRINDVEESFVLESKYSQNLNLIIESHSRSIKSLLEIVSMK